MRWFFNTFGANCKKFCKVPGTLYEFLLKNLSV